MMAARCLLSGLLSFTTAQVPPSRGNEGIAYLVAFVVVLAFGCLMVALYFYVLARPAIRRAVEARGGTVESVRFGLRGLCVTYRTKVGERRVVNCVVHGSTAFFADDDGPALG